MLSDNKIITTIIGVGAFVIGGLMARQTTIEGLELFDEKIDAFKHRNDPTPPIEFSNSTE